MESSQFHADVIVNDVYYQTSLIDNGNSCYATINTKLAKRCHIPLIPIPPRQIEGIFDGPCENIEHVARFSIDVGGHRNSPIFAYVVPNQKEDLILCRPWLQQNLAVLDEGNGTLTFAMTSVVVHDTTTAATHNYDHCCIGASAFAASYRRTREDSIISIFAASMKDIDKALQIKAPVDPRPLLPIHYHDFLEVFEPSNATKLPPHRAGIDHEITLEKDGNGKEKEVPWGPLYSMSRDELLVLRKTLTELLDQNFIRVSKSSAGAPVLFAKKPGGGLRFCVDYRGLNAITKKDRYPLPLIKETLRALNQACWLTKLDVSAAFHRIRVKAGEEWKTAMRTRYGSYEWLVTHSA